VARREWPLVAFTLLGQTAVGAFWLTAVPLSLSPRRALEAGDLSAGFLVYGGIAALLGIAAAISFFHLGRPWRAIHALRNIGDSWLSREIFGELVFLFLTANLAFLEWIMPGCTGRAAILQAAVLFTGASGLLFLYGMARLYMLKTIPAWRDPYTPASFLATALLLGALASAAFLSSAGMGREGQGFPSIRSLTLIAFAGTVVGLVVSVLLTPQVGMFGARIATLLAPSARKAVPFLVARGFLLAGAGAAVLMYGARLKAVPAATGNPFLWLALAGGAAAELAGRWLFYTLYSRLGV
jgi:anaerobic dimethyl sulfoxide reductase subunit C (anchor subunit)